MEGGGEGGEGEGEIVKGCEGRVQGGDGGEE